jgi:hypothetical protein
MTIPAISTRAHLADFFSRVDPVRARAIFAIDATASREPTWDLASGLQFQMFDTVAAVGGLDVQLMHFGGEQCVASRWISDPRALAAIMAKVTCRAGHTKIQQVLAHTRKEHAREKVGALILVSDACEETPHTLYNEARELGGVPVFLFQEGDDERVAGIYSEIAKITGGAYAKFDASAAQRLGDLLKAVAAFAAGGVKALAAQNSEAARLLLTQVKKK